MYKIEKPNWSQVNQNHKTTLAKIITQGGWHQIDHMRRGFLNCKIEDDILYGYFAQEGRIKIEQYNDEQQPQSDETESFERILFLFLLEPGIIAVQSIRVARYIDLTGTQIRSSFFNLLESTFRRANLVFKGGVNIERYKEELSREELIQVFENHEINRIKVKDLTNAKIPDDFKFFNPNFDADLFLKDVIEGDLENTDEAELQGHNIQNTKLARGFMQAGNPALIEGQDDLGYPREWTPSAPQSISVELDTDEFSLPEEDLQKLLVTIRRAFGLFSERLRQFQDKNDLGDLPLFDTQNE